MSLIRIAGWTALDEVAELILSFPEERPVINLSAMGKTTNKLILAGELASSCCAKVSEIEGLSFIKELHYRTIDELGLDKSLITEMFCRPPKRIRGTLKGLAVMKELTPRQRSYIVSFGECMSARIFAAYLNKIGVKARQFKL
ncbi:aspartokinase [Artemisia annua]|uniref:Aspartokinase n=1 Tax=Artemisia annua TaxID=35608 RepID=A0A2U1M7U2_ARTAN|nr:aspartokinase [Artemisia annua]